MRGSTTTNGKSCAGAPSAPSLDSSGSMQHCSVRRTAHQAVEQIDLTVVLVQSRAEDDPHVLLVERLGCAREDDRRSRPPATSGRVTPMSPVRPPESARALRFVVKPCSRTARSTASRVSGATSGRPLRTRETVAIETPARARDCRESLRACLGCCPCSSSNVSTLSTGNGYRKYVTLTVISAWCQDEHRCIQALTRLTWSVNRSRNRDRNSSASADDGAPHVDHDPHGSKTNPSAPDATERKAGNVNFSVRSSRSALRAVGIVSMVALFASSSRRPPPPHRPRRQARP